MRRFLVPVIALLIDRFLKVLVEVIPPRSADFSFVRFSIEHTPTTTLFGFFSFDDTIAVVLMSVVFLGVGMFALHQMSHSIPSIHNPQSVTAEAGSRCGGIIHYCPLLFILFGGASNLYDRWISGAVIDVFRMSVGANAFVFNIADFMIFVGILLFFYRRSS